ncbi:YhcH/YjgK/YiaL family protein [Shewanella marina]|uniref:YhcH/YjgK/YiaL family protein n=1 Tax=Shewanella marina TaxID=487319 RepID=UPI0004724D9E|nr:YhcH/YjgK/YiaL family protein [Shewanella marina]
MLHGNLNDLAQYHHIPTAILSIISKVKALLAVNNQPGRYSLEQDNFYFIVNDHTQELALRRSEIHAKYIDVQIILEGGERFGYSLNPLVSITEDLLDSKDIAFSNDVINEQFINLNQNEFIIFDALQPHRPLIAVTQPAPVKKLVIKIEKSSITAAA